MTDMATAFDAVIGNRGHLENLIGFEPVGRACRVVLLEGLNDEITRQQERWHAADLVLQELGLDEGVGQTAVQPVQPRNLFEGPHKSLLTSPPDRFPNVSMAAYIVAPSGEQFDQFDTSDLTLFVENMAIAGPVQKDQETVFETIVHRRIQRMTEAVVATIRQSGTLLNTVNPIQVPPRGGIGNATWLGKPDKGAGPRYLWQGSRLQYTLKRHAAIS